MEAFQGVGMKNRYSCFSLMNEDDVEDVSVDKLNDPKKKKVTSTKVKTVEGLSQKIEPTKKIEAVSQRVEQSKKVNMTKKVAEVRPDFIDNTPGVVSRQKDDVSNSNVKQGGKGNNASVQKRATWNPRKDMTSVVAVVEEKLNESAENPDETEILKIDDGNVEKVEEEVDESKLMTLDEWKAMQQPREKPVFNLRKAGEGEDLSKWTKMVLKKDEEEGQHSEEYETYDSEHPQRAGRCKPIKIDGLFTALPREQGHGRGDRDMRVSNRDGRRFNNRRNAYSAAVTVSKSAPKVDDINDFPSLC